MSSQNKRDTHVLGMTVNRAKWRSRRDEEGTISYLESSYLTSPSWLEKKREGSGARPTPLSFCSLAVLCAALHYPNAWNRLRRDKTRDSRKFRYRADFDWLERQYKWPEVKYQGVRWSFVWKLGMRNSTGSPIFSKSKSDLSRFAHLVKPALWGTKTHGTRERTADRWVGSSCAHAWLCKFTSGSCPSSSRRRILGSLLKTS